MSYVYPCRVSAARRRLAGDPFEFCDCVHPHGINRVSKLLRFGITAAVCVFVFLSWSSNAAMAQTSCTVSGFDQFVIIEDVGGLLTCTTSNSEGATVAIWPTTLSPVPRAPSDSQLTQTIRCRPSVGLVSYKGRPASLASPSDL